MVNVWRTARSDSPTYLSSSSGPCPPHQYKVSNRVPRRARCVLQHRQRPVQSVTLMEMKLARLSFATAFANSVLPQPGGPYKSTPAGTLIPRRWYLRIVAERTVPHHCHQRRLRCLGAVAHTSSPAVWACVRFRVCFARTQGVVASMAMPALITCLGVGWAPQWLVATPVASVSHAKHRQHRFAPRAGSL